MKNIYSLISKIPSLYDLASSIIGYTASVDYFVSKIPFASEDAFAVLDAGCGTGPYTLALLRRFKNCRIVAFDLDEELVVSLKRKVGENERIRAYVGDVAKQLHFLSNEKFDVIVTAGVLEYVPITDVVKNLSRHLNTGGYFLNSPVRDTCWGRIVCKVYQCRPYSSETNIAAFLENGYVLIKYLVLPKYRPASFKEAYIFTKTN